MADQSRDNQDTGGISDNVEVVIRGSDGEVKERVGRRGARALLRRLAREEDLESESSESLDQMLEDEGITITEPLDPEKMEGKKRRASRQEKIQILASRRAPLRVGEILFEGTAQEIKGGGPEWEKDEEGNYVNR